MGSKNLYIGAMVTILVVAMLAGYIYFKNNDSSQYYTEYHFELEMESDNQTTTVYWPIPHDSYGECDSSDGNLSELVYELEITSGSGLLNINQTKHGRALEVKFNGSVEIKGNERLYEDEYENQKDFENDNLNYSFDDLTMRNKNKEDTYFVYTSDSDVKVISFYCYIKGVGKLDSEQSITKEKSDLDLEKGWQSVEL